MVCAPLGGRGRLSPSPSCWGWWRRSTLVRTFIIPESWRWRQEAHCRSQHMQEGAKVLQRKMAGSPQQSPSDLSLSSNVGPLRFPSLFKNFFLSFTLPDCHPPPSCLLGSDANRVHSLLTFATLELHTYICCKWSIDLQPGWGKSSLHWLFKVALGLCNSRPSCAHQNLNDPSTFTHLWKTRRRLIRAPVLRIPEQFHEAF